MRITWLKVCYCRVFDNALDEFWMQPFSKTYSWWSVFSEDCFSARTTKLSVRKEQNFYYDDIGMQFFTAQGLKISYSAQTMKLMSFICQVEWKVWMFKKHLLKRIMVYFILALLMEENYCLEVTKCVWGEAVLLIQCWERINSKMSGKISSTFVINWFVWSLSNHLCI